MKSTNTNCGDCTNLVQTSGYCCKYKFKLCRDKESKQPLKCIECIMYEGDRDEN